VVTEKRKHYKTLFKSMSLASILLWSNGNAMDSKTLPRQQGELYISGEFREGPCFLDMRSKFQDVELDNSAIANLRNIGDTGQPRKLILHLWGCKTLRLKNKYGVSAINVHFMAPADADEPTLFRLNGASGIGLRVIDDAGHQILPGKERQLLFHSSSDNNLELTVLPVRTKAPLSTGYFDATINFGLNYE
jgi:type 1 fimbria pilin